MENRKYRKTHTFPFSNSLPPYGKKAQPGNNIFEFNEYIQICTLFQESIIYLTCSSVEISVYTPGCIK